MGDFNINLLKVNIHAKTNEFVNDVGPNFAGILTVQWRIVGSRGPGARNYVGPSASGEPTFPSRVSGATT